MIAAVPAPSADNKMIDARHACFCGAFRSLTTRSSSSRSGADTSNLIPVRMAPNRTVQQRRESQKKGLICQALSARACSYRKSHPTFSEQALLWAYLRIPIDPATYSDLNSATSSRAVPVGLWARRPSPVAVRNQQDGAFPTSPQVPAKRGATGGRAILGMVVGFNWNLHILPGG